MALASSCKTRWPWRAAVSGLAHVAMAIMLVAGLSKATDLTEFAGSVSTWRVPRWAVMPLAVAVPFVEIALAGFWFLGGRRRTALLGAIALLCTFTAAYVVHLVFFGRPDCNCLGRILQLRELNKTAWFVVTRNTVLIGFLAIGTVGGPSNAGRAIPEGGRR